MEKIKQRNYYMLCYIFILVIMAICFICTDLLFQSIFDALKSHDSFGNGNLHRLNMIFPLVVAMQIFSMLFSIGMCIFVYRDLGKLFGNSTMLIEVTE